MSFLLSVFALNMDQSLNILKFELFFKVYKKFTARRCFTGMFNTLAFFSFLDIFPSSIRK